LKEKIKPIMENMIFNLVCEKPENPALFMITWLQKEGGYTSNGLTIDEKNELERLRNEIRKYREMEAHNADDGGSVKSDDSDHHEEEEKVHEIDLGQAKARLSVPRAAVSAEVYGAFNKKEDFQARVIKEKRGTNPQNKSTYTTVISF